MSTFLLRRSRKKLGVDLNDQVESLVSLKEENDGHYSTTGGESAHNNSNDDNNNNNLAYFHPISNIRLTWDVLTSIILLLNILFIPFNLAFLGRNDDHIFWEIFQMFSDSWFILDIFVNLNSGVMLDGIEGEVIMDITESRKIYFKGWFTLDLISTIPFDVFVVMFSYFLTGSTDLNDLGVSDAGGHGTQKRIWLRLIKSIKLFRMLKLLRLPRFLRLFMNVEDVLHFSFDHMLTVMKIVNQMGMLFLIIHYMACVQYLGCYAFQNNPSIPSVCDVPPMTNKYGCAAFLKRRGSSIGQITNSNFFILFVLTDLKISHFFSKTLQHASTKTPGPTFKASTNPKFASPTNTKPRFLGQHLRCSALATESSCQEQLQI